MAYKAAGSERNEKEQNAPPDVELDVELAARRVSGWRAKQTESVSAMNTGRAAESGGPPHWEGRRGSGPEGA
ncbi:hypothetical protein GCM10008961_25070 [Deinococcus knuensis]|uniref:Uncharacterized protein n=1 Tax=Deinococcus knuensis TaxID=1837380 RepID=A0ABQ2SK12_9DEIO|nr:hypothetical protein GCM10008961_25070 [Deinococcus knuensis]